MSSGIRALCAPILLAAACQAVGPDYERPEVDVPEEWAGAEGAVYTGLPEAALARWWEELGDPELTSLVDRALEGNLDLLAAFERVRQARALRDASAGQRVPDVDGTGGYSRVRAGENSFPPLADASTFDQWTIGLEAGWELDVWGRVSRLVEASEADLSASAEDARDVRTLVAAEVARQYIDLRTFQARLAVARRNIDLQQQSLEIAQARFREGLSPALDVAQAETNLASTEAEVPNLEIGLRAAALRLGVLLGLPPTELFGELDADLATVVPLPAPPDEIGVGVPADLLRQRPDVRATERALASAVARIGVAKADYYPRFQLGGSIGYEALSTGDLLDTGSGFLGLGPSFRWNLFDGGRIRGNLEAQRALAEAARLRYRASVLAALEEVELALVAHARQRDRREALLRAAAAAQRTVDLARELYTAGQSDFQNVLDAERSLFSAEDRLLATRGELARTYVNLQLALGGGWQRAADETSR